MRLILTKPVKKWLDKEKDIQQEDLIIASNEVIKGVFEANLGGNLYKKRISNNSNQGKSGGSRLIVGYKQGNNFYVLFVFNKNESDNITTKEKQIFKGMAKQYLKWNNNELDIAITAKILFEVELEEQRGEDNE
ncbi:type II toxin-antitoxin system RelE/ParE family toxin [Lentisphaera profundi]|uniref:Type II toxin-antitoxin system RelE/ParE family toxin n=1 Tax=Lentisphaera profundi TaxID=1658616 RepID=A0ABY7VTK6_9BACT|nr:type II toxin-antitoxin system RelE/ParE family toxin [Lentisphaera profundi]WDE97397.1 type II toxin-antitoxin system RelE/ParE family toxin [Lentisphaera profundi]